MKFYVALGTVLFCCNSFAAESFKCDLLSDDGSVVPNGRVFVNTEKALFTVGRGHILDYLLTESTVQPPNAPVLGFGRPTECKQTTMNKDQIITHSFKCSVDVDGSALGLDVDLLFNSKNRSGEYRGVIRDGSNDKFAIGFKNCQITQ